MTWTLATLSEPGSRPVQQDRWGDAAAAGVRCYALADGLGGHGGGELAAHLAIAAILSGFAAEPEAAPAALLEAANQAIAAAQKEHEMQRQMRSTGVVLCLEENRARWAHVGDSRLYAFAGMAIVAQTKDHSVPQALVDAGELSAEQLRFHVDRNRLVRSLGSDGPCRPTAGELTNGDGFLLASDGFWEGVLEATMLAAWTSTTTAAGWLEQMAAGLTAPADNCTALAIRRAP